MDSQKNLFFGHVRIPAISYLIPLFTLIYIVLFHLLPQYYLDVPCYLNNRQRYCSVWSEREGLFTLWALRCSSTASCQTCSSGLLTLLCNGMVAMSLGGIFGRGIARSKTRVYKEDDLIVSTMQAFGLSLAFSASSLFSISVIYMS